MEDPSSGGVLLGLAAVLFLVLANAFFVAAEFALVASRQTRIDAMVDAGDVRALVVQNALRELDRYISGAQVGITIASLGLGWIGEPALAHLIEGGFTWLPGPMEAIATHAVAVAISFAIITYLHIVLGELVPKAIALLYPENTSRWVAGSLIWFTRVMGPFIWMLNGSQNIILKLLGMGTPTEGERVHRPEEIVMLIKESRESGHIAAEDVQMIEGVFGFTGKTARDVMTPRTKVVALPDGITVEEAADKIAETGKSRFPVYSDTLDDVTGVLLVKEVLPNLKEGRYRKVSELARTPLFVPGTRGVSDLMADMKREKSHLAIVLDEYGGTAGIVTMEDMLEEIVGEIYDEHDESEEIEGTGDGRELAGDTPIAEANERFDVQIPGGDYTTIGGYVFGRLGRLPEVGDRIRFEGGILEILEMEGRRIARLRLISPRGPVSPDD